MNGTWCAGVVAEVEPVEAGEVEVAALGQVGVSPVGVAGAELVSVRATRRRRISWAGKNSVSSQGHGKPVSGGQYILASQRLEPTVGFIGSAARYTLSF